MKIDPSDKFSGRAVSVTLKFEPLEVDLSPSTEGVAEAMAGDLRQAIAAQPGDKWDKTGKLKSGVHVGATDEGHAVLPPAGRLERDDLRVKFAAEVTPTDPFKSRNVEAAIGKMLDEVVK